MTFEKVATILVEALNVDLSDIKPETTLKGDLGAESIDVLDMVFRLEREFNIKISTDEMFPRGAENFEAFTVQSMVDYIDKVKK
jgi:acyl carrier protein